MILTIIIKSKFNKIKIITEMSDDDLTVFDIKYKEGMDRLNNLLSIETNQNFIKNYVEKYKLEKAIENKNIKNNENKKNNQKDEKRKQIVNLNEIRIHEKKTQQYYNKNYIKNEIEWYKIKKREDELKNKYNNNYNRQRYENNLEIKETSKDAIRNNQIKMKKFSNLANKVNIEKLKKNKLNKSNNIRGDIMRDNIDDNNNGGIFIPYSKYKENEQIKSYKNKNRINNMNTMNINTNKSENLKNINKINKLQKKINNNISQNINNKDIKKNKNEKKNLKPIDNNRYKIDKRKPLDVKIDYLRKMENNNNDLKVKIYENKKLLKDKDNISDNIEILNFHSKNYEDKAKRQEQLMRIKGNSNDRNEDNVKLSNLLIDSISTKLAILNQMSS